MTTSLTSLPAQDRIDSIDVLRGFALIGIFIMNIDSFNRPASFNFLGIEAGLQGFDWWWSWFVLYFVTGKFWTVFALVFGMGFAVMLERAQARQQPFVLPYLRRIAGLLLLALLHVGLLWSGDVLSLYALAALGLLGLMFLRIRYMALLCGLGIGLAVWAGAEIQAKSLAYLLLANVLFRLRWPAWRVAVVLLLVTITLSNVQRVSAYLQGASTATANTKRFAKAVQEAEHEKAVYKSGSFAVVAQHRLGEAAEALTAGFNPSTHAIAAFLLGAWLINAGILRRISAHRRLLRGLALFGLLFGLGLSVASMGFGTLRNLLDARDPFVLGSVLRSFGNPAASIGYVAALLLLADGGRASLARALAPLGRMSLSNYLVQSLLSSLIFYGYGLGYYGASRATQCAYVCALLCLQWLASRWWLARFEQGPVEALLRAITYWQWPRWSKVQVPALAQA